MKIIVLSGGISNERYVSLKAGEIVAKTLQMRGHRVLLLDLYTGYPGSEHEVASAFDKDLDIPEQKEIPLTEPDPQNYQQEFVKAGRDNQRGFGPNVLPLCEMADVVFTTLYGGDGENGRIQATFDMMGICYTGNHYLSCGVMMDKGIAKQVLKEYGIPCPEGFSLTEKEKNFKAKKEAVSFPCIVKPSSCGSSIGVSLARNEEQLKKSMDLALMWNRQIMVEDYIEGREFVVGIVDGVALPVVEVSRRGDYLDYFAKYHGDASYLTCPAQLHEDLATQLQVYAERTATAMNLDTYATMDFVLDQENNIYFLEVNATPKLLPNSPLVVASAYMHTEYGDLCDDIVKMARNQKR